MATCTRCEMQNQTVGEKCSHCRRLVIDPNPPVDHRADELEDVQDEDQVTELEDPQPTDSESEPDPDDHEPAVDDLMPDVDPDLQGDAEAIAEFEDDPPVG